MDFGVWIGLTTQVAELGPWTWSSDSQTATWTNWDEDETQPDGDGYCVYACYEQNEYGTIGKWIDLDCDKDRLQVMCQTGGRWFTDQLLV